MNVDEIRKVYNEAVKTQNLGAEAFSHAAVKTLLDRIDELKDSEKSLARMAVAVSMKVVLSMIPEEQIKKISERWESEGPEISIRFMDEWEKPLKVIEKESLEALREILANDF